MKTYNNLAKKGKLEKSTPDSEKIRDPIKSKLDPLEIAKDKAINALVKHYLPQSLPFLEWANNPMSSSRWQRSLDQTRLRAITMSFQDGTENARVGSSILSVATPSPSILLTIPIHGLLSLKNVPVLFQGRRQKHLEAF